LQFSTSSFEVNSSIGDSDTLKLVLENRSSQYASEFFWHYNPRLGSKLLLELCPH